MKIKGSVAVVIGAGGGVGAAIVQALHDRGAARVYQTAAEARKKADLTLLVHCLSARQLRASRLAGSDLQAAGRSSLPMGQTVALIEDFAPILAANGGGAVVNVMCVHGADQPVRRLRSRLPKVASSTIDWVLSIGLRDCLAAQGTKLIYFRAQIATSSGDHVPDEQHVLNRHVAMRVLDRLESDEHLVGSRSQTAAQLGHGDDIAAQPKDPLEQET